MRSFLISAFRGQQMAICESSSSNETARSCFRRHLPRAVFSNESQPVDTPHIPTFFVHDTPIFEKKTPRRRSVPAARWRMRGSTSGVDHPNSPRGVAIDANQLTLVLLRRNRRAFCVYCLLLCRRPIPSMVRLILRKGRLRDRQT